MARTLEKWKREWERLVWLINFHKKPFWMVATEDDYAVSCLEPEERNIPEGTAAVLWGPGEDGDPDMIRRKTREGTTGPLKSATQE